MEINKNMPEGNKTETVEGKPKTITEKIPEKYVKKIQ